MGGHLGHRPDERLALDAGRQAHARLDGARHRGDGHPGPAFLGRGDERGLADQADGSPAAGDGDQAAGVGLPGPADGLGERQVVGHGERPAGQPSGDQCGQLAARLGRGERRRGGRPEEQRDHGGQHEVEDVGGGAEQPLLEQRPGQRGDGGHAAGPGGHDRALEHVAGRPPDRGLEHPAAVQRQPGNEVEDADDEVGPGEALHGHQQQAVGSHEPQPEGARARPRSRSAARRRR